MNLQKSILEDYLQRFKKPTLKLISADTGIQMTRVFRIMNGAIMHLDEFEVFYKKVQERKSNQGCLGDLLFECELNLSREVLDGVGQMLRKKIHLAKLQKITI